MTYTGNGFFNDILKKKIFLKDIYSGLFPSQSVKAIENK